MPPFILPFSYICIDGEVEFVYQIGLYSKLQYMSGSRLPTEYAEIWTSVLSPLCDCKDWFMKPYSFLLSTDYLYYDKNKKTIGYVYIPSTRDLSNHDNLKELATDISELISVEDAQLENKVFRAIMKNFDPKELLQTLRSYKSEGSHSPKALIVHTNDQKHLDKTTLDNGEDITYKASEKDMYISPLLESVMENNPKTSARKHEAINEKRLEIRNHDSRDIVIDISEKGSRKKKPSDKGDKEKRKDKKKHKNENSIGGLFGRIKFLRPSKKKMQQNDDFSDSAFTETSLELDKTTLGTGANMSEALPLVAPAETIYDQESSDITESISTLLSGARLRSIGRPHLPLVIDVQIDEGEIFSIGRFDAAVGRQQSDFEFDRKMKAVSRRHAVIERLSDGYSIIDLSSSAGTYVDDEKILPNAPYKLYSNSRVSFGNSGADYIWED